MLSKPSRAIFLFPMGDHGRFFEKDIPSLAFFILHVSKDANLNIEVSVSENTRNSRFHCFDR